MAKALYTYKYDADAIIPRTFGLPGFLAISTAFLLIQLNLALRLPIVATGVPLFEERAWTSGSLPEVLSHWTMAAGSLIAQDPLGGRLGFALITMLTALAAARIAAILYPKTLSPALTLVWLNTSLLFGLAGFLTRDATLTAFFVTTGTLALCRLLQSQRQVWWLPTAGCYLTALALDPRLIAIAPGFLAAPLIFGELRNWLLRPGFWVASLSMIAVFTMSFDVSVLAGLAAADALSTSVLATLPRDIGVAALFMSPAIALGTLVGLKDAWTTTLERTTKRLLIVLIAPLLMLSLVTGADLEPVFPVFPVLAAIAAGGLLQSRRFFSRWLSEVITPFAFGSYLFVMGLLLYPGSELTHRLPVLDQVFGWDSVAARVDQYADLYQSAWIATDTKMQTLALAPHMEARTVRPIADEQHPAVFCTRAGLFLSEAQNPNPVIRQFREFKRLGVIMRRVDGRPISTFELFYVVGPTGPAPCAPVTVAAQ